MTAVEVDGAVAKPPSAWSGDWVAVAGRAGQPSTRSTSSRTIGCITAASFLFE